jgi:fimbrial isopeptide formation D2 family protein
MNKRKWTTFIAVVLILVLAFPMGVFAAIGVPSTALPGGSYGGTFGTKGVYTSWVATSNAFKVTDSQYTITMQDVSDTKYERVAKTTDLPLSIANTLGPLDSAAKRDNYWQFSTVGSNAVASGDTLMWIRHAAVRNLAEQSIDYIDVKISLRSYDNGASGNNTIAVKKDVRTSVEIYNMQEAFLEWDFYYEGTSKKYNYKSNVTFSDIDTDQYCGVRDDDVKKVFADKDSNLKYNLLTSSGDVKYHMFSGTVVTQDDHEEDAIGYLVDTDSLRMVFGRVSGAGHAHFGYYKYSMIPHDDTPPTISKEVTDSDESGVTKNTLANRNEKFRYRLETTVPSGMYRGYSEFNIVDDIDSCLVVDRVTATHQSGSCETSEWTKESGADTAGANKWFNIAVSGNKVTVSAKKAALSMADNAAFYGGGNRESRYVAVNIYVHIDPDISLAQLAAHKHNISANLLKFENIASVDVGGGNHKSNWVQTDVTQPKPPQGPVKRVSDNDENNVTSNRLKTKAESFTYHVIQAIPDGQGDKNYYTGFRIEDQIDTCLKIESVTVTQKDKGDRTSWFTVLATGNKVVATAKASALKDDDFCSGDTEFTMNITVKIDPAKSEAIKTHGGGTGHYNADGDLITFSNIAATIIDTTSGLYNQQTNTVTTRLAVPRKNVTDSDEVKVTMDRIINANEPFTYRVRQAVLDGINGTTSKFGSFSFSDTLDTCLKVAGVKVISDDNADVTNQFDVAITGHSVTANAKAAALADPAFYASGAGTGYTLVIEAALDQTKTVADLKSHGHYNATFDEMSFSNSATVTIDGDQAGTNNVVTKVGVPDLEIKKDVNRYEHQVGDRVKYTVTVKHTAKSTSDATSVVIKDVSLPKGFKVDLASCKVSGIATANKSFAAAGEGFEFKTDIIAKNETAVITFDAIPSSAQNGKIIDNTVTVTAYSMIEEKKDSESVYINSPKLDLVKTTHKNQYKVGDTISYRLELTQKNIGTFMRDIIITDGITHGGITLIPGSIQVMNSDNKIITHLCDITVSGNAFNIDTHLNIGDMSRTVPPKAAGIEPYASLALENKLIVTYDVSVTSDELSGLAVKNVAVAPSRPNTNGDIIKDDPEIPSGGDTKEKDTPITGATLKIVKSSDKKVYKVSDTATYTLKVNQIREDYTAKNVVIKDSFDTTLSAITLAAIVSDSIRVELDKEDITSDCAIALTDTGFEIETNHDLKWGEDMTVSYEVVFTEAAAGNTIHNLAITKADNADERNDKNAVTVVPNDVIPVEAQLEIKKTSDKQTYKVGDEVHYTLDTVCISTEPAVNVRIQDCIMDSGAIISPASIKVMQGESDITSACDIKITGNEFEVDTGVTLAKGAHITVTYTAKIESAELAGNTITNIAVASADNGPDTEDENEVKVDKPEPIPNEPKPTAPTVQEDTPASDAPKNTPTPKNPNNSYYGQPKTGDDFPLALVVCILLVAALSLLALLGYRKRIKSIAKKK